MSVPNNVIFNIRQVIAAVDGATNSFLSCVALAVTELFDSTYSSESGMRKFRHYGATGGRDTAWRAITPFCITVGEDNTGYKGYTTLEEYYIDDNTATGTTKDNLDTDPDYVYPIHDTVTCALTPWSLSWNYNEGGYGNYKTLTPEYLSNWTLDSIPSGWGFKDASGNDVDTGSLFYAGQTIRIYPLANNSSSTVDLTGTFNIGSMDGASVVVNLTEFMAPAVILVTLVNGHADATLSWTEDSANILETTTLLNIGFTATYPFAEINTNYNIDRNGHSAGSGSIDIVSGSNSFTLTMTESAVLSDTITITFNY